MAMYHSWAKEMYGLDQFEDVLTKVCFFVWCNQQTLSCSSKDDIRGIMSNYRDVEIQKFEPLLFSRGLMGSHPLLFQPLLNEPQQGEQTQQERSEQAQQQQESEQTQQEQSEQQNEQQTTNTSNNTTEQPQTPPSTVSSTNREWHAHFTIMITPLCRMLLPTARLDSSLPQRHLHNLFPLANLHLLTVRSKHLRLIPSPTTHLNIPFPLRLHHLRLSHHHHHGRENHQHRHVAVELRAEERNRTHLAQHLRQSHGGVRRLRQLRLNEKSERTWRSVKK